MNKPRPRHRPIAAAILLTALGASTSVPIQSAHANRRAAMTQRVTPITTGASKARQQKFLGSRRAKFRVGAAGALAKPHNRTALAPRRAKATQSQYSVGTIAAGGAITAMVGALSLKMASLSIAVFGETLNSSEPALVAFGVVTVALTVLTGGLTGLLGKGVIKATRDALR